MEKFFHAIALCILAYHIVVPAAIILYFLARLI